MAEHVLLLVDGSPQSECATALAQYLAQRRGNDIVLVRATPEPVEGPRSEDEMVADVSATAETLRERGVNVTATIVKGQPVDVIIDISREYQAQLVIMPSPTGAGLGRWVHGSLADSILHRAAVPLLLVPSACRRTWYRTEESRMGSVLVPLDGSEAAEAVLGPAIALADAFDARSLLVRVVELAGFTALPNASCLVSDLEAEHAEATRYLRSIAASLRAQGRPVELRDVIGFAGPAIAALADEDEVVAIALTTQGKGGQSRFIKNTVADAVLRHASVPVLIISPESAAVETAPEQGGREAGGRPIVSLQGDEVAIVERALGELRRNAAGDDALVRSVDRLLHRLARSRVIARGRAVRQN